MIAEAEPASAAGMEVEPARASALPWTRTFAWSLWRELWEHRALYLAPAVVAAFVALVHVLSALATSPEHRAHMMGQPGGMHQFMGSYEAAAGMIVTAGLLVGALYSAGALYGERRDRSVLFWKALPVSDTATVLAKAAIPTLVLPLVIFVSVVAASAVTAVLQSLIWLARGSDVGALWAGVDLPFIWLSLLYALPFMALWYAPMYAWLLLVSGWARRWPFLWAMAPLAAFLIVEHGALHRTRVHWASERWIGGGVIQPYSVGGEGRVWIQRLADLEPARLWTLPQLWIGVALAVLFLALAVRLRRTQGPL